jgi:hypothetical protein
MSSSVPSGIIQFVSSIHLSHVSLPVPSAGQSIVVASIFGELYSTNDGASFTASIGGGTSQSVRYVGLDSNKNEVFGVTGQYGKIEVRRGGPHIVLPMHVEDKPLQCFGAQASSM